MGNNYKNILLALELTDIDKKPIEQAINLAHLSGANLHLIHAVDHLSAYSSIYDVSFGIKIEKSLYEHNEKLLNKLSVSIKEKIREEHLNFSLISSVIRYGMPKTIVLEYASECEADLIVVGSHGKHGVGILIGSTSNAVLQGAHCNVLTVKN